MGKKLVTRTLEAFNNGKFCNHSGGGRGKNLPKIGCLSPKFTIKLLEFKNLFLNIHKSLYSMKSTSAD